MSTRSNRWNAERLYEVSVLRIRTLHPGRSRRRSFSRAALLSVCLLIIGCHNQREVAPSFQNPPINAANCRSRMSLAGSQQGHYTLKAGEGDTGSLTVSVTNLGQQIWVDQGERPFRLGIMWFRGGTTDETPQVVVREQRIALPDIVVAGDTVDLNGYLGPVEDPDEYEVWIGPVQDGVAWCWHFGDVPLKVKVHVQ